MIARTLSSLLLAAAPLCAYFPEDFEAPLETVAFGSCNRDELPQPLWDEIAFQLPDLWIWAGDNIYTDWYAGDDRRGGITAAEWAAKRYEAQFNRPDYTAFREAFPILGTWDDHDYGKNNAGAEYELKTVTEELLLDFLEVPANDPRRERPGVYGSHVFGPEGKQTKVILIDNRYFATGPGAEEPSLLGEAQRQWLASELTDSGAELHLIVSGTQVLSQEHRWEKWDQYPETRQWLLDLIVERQVPGVIFLSGDRHFHEISRLELDGLPYPLIDLTSSGLTHYWESFPGEPNRHRVGEVYAGLGYGLLRIDWEAEPVEVSFEIHSEAEEPELQLSVPYPGFATADAPTGEE